MAHWRNMAIAAGAAGGSVLYPNVVIALSPLIYWRCNTGPGPVFVNEGTLAPGTFDGLENGTNLSTGLLGAGADPGNNFSMLTGIIQDFTSFSSSLYPSAYQACSMECWISTTSANGVMMQIQDPLQSNNTGRSFELSMNIDGLTLRARRRNSQRLSTTTINDGSPHHIVATAPAADPDGPIRLYIDGAEEFGATLGGVSGSISTAFALHTGANVVGAGNPLSPHNIQEVAVYDFELTPTQVLQHFTVGSQ